MMIKKCENSLILDHMIRQMPGFAAWKTPDSVYASANQLCAELAGYKDIDSYIGRKDTEWKCDAVSLADKIVAQDKLVLESKRNWSSFNILKFSKGITYYFSNKSVITATNGDTLGILFVGTIITDVQIIKMLNSLVHSDPGKSLEKIQNTIYSTNQNNNHNLNLSLREEECLFYLLRRKSAKETAKILNISYRTVEAHIEKIKDKFKCRTKSELFSKSVENGCFYHIPSSLLGRNGVIEEI